MFHVKRNGLKPVSVFAGRFLLGTVLFCGMTEVSCIKSHVRFSEPAFAAVTGGGEHRKDSGTSTSEVSLNKDHGAPKNPDAEPDYMSYGSRMQGWSLASGITQADGQNDRQPHGEEEDGGADDDNPRVNEYMALLEEKITDSRNRMESSRQEMEKRRADLEKEEEALKGKMRALDESTNSLTGKKTRSRAEIEAGINRMAHVYEIMPPRSAGAMFDTLDMRVMVPITQHMNPRKASTVMGFMSPDRANILSQYLAGTRKLSEDTINKMSEAVDYQVPTAPLSEKSGDQANGQQ